MNTVSLTMPRGFQALSSGAIEVNSIDSSAFSNILQTMQGVDSGVQLQQAELQQNSTQNIISMLSKILGQLINGEAEEIPADQLLTQLDGMTEEQLTQIADECKGILSFIAHKSAKSKLEQNEDEITDTLLSQVAVISAPTMINNPQELQTSNQQEISIEITKSSTKTMDILQKVIIKADNTNSIKQTNEIDGLNQFERIVAKLSEACEEKLNSQIKIESNTFSTGDKNNVEELVRSSANQQSYIKPVKKSDELGELMAYSSAGVNTTKTSVVADESVILQAGESVKNQISQQIIEQIQGTENAFNHKELTIKLNPEELGEVSIKLEKSGEEIKISIMAQNSNTQKLISEKLPNLITSLQQINSQVKDVAIVNQNDNASSFFNNFAQSQSQSGGQYQARHSQSANHYISIPENETEENILIREGELWQTA